MVWDGEKWEIKERQGKTMRNDCVLQVLVCACNVAGTAGDSEHSRANRKEQKKNAPREIRERARIAVWMRLGVAAVAQ